MKNLIKAAGVCYFSSVSFAFAGNMLDDFNLMLGQSGSTENITYGTSSIDGNNEVYDDVIFLLEEEKFNADKMTLSSDGDILTIHLENLNATEGDVSFTTGHFIIQANKNNIKNLLLDQYDAFDCSDWQDTYHIQVVNGEFLMEDIASDLSIDFLDIVANTKNLEGVTSEECILDAKMAINGMSLNFEDYVVQLGGARLDFKNPISENFSYEKFGEMYTANFMMKGLLVSSLTNGKLVGLDSLSANSTVDGDSMVSLAEAGINDIIVELENYEANYGAQPDPFEFFTADIWNAVVDMVYDSSFNLENLTLVPASINPMGAMLSGHFGEEVKLNIKSKTTKNAENIGVGFELSVDKLADLGIGFDVVLEKTDVIPSDPELAMMTLPVYIKNISANFSETGADNLAQMMTGKGLEDNAYPLLNNPVIPEENSKLLFDWFVSSLGNKKAFFEMSFSEPMGIIDLMPYMMSDWKNLRSLGTVESNLE